MKKQTTTPYVAKPRINAGILKQFVGHDVTFIGIVQNIGSGFMNVTSSDNVVVKIFCKNMEHLQQGLPIEVLGKVNQDGTIIATEAFILPEQSDKFIDMDLYNKMITHMHQNCRQPFMEL